MRIAPIMYGLPVPDPQLWRDVREGKLRWDLHEPYMLGRAEDGYCTHLQDGGMCECYGERPATCREYDCRADARVWLDWDKKIPAPLPPVIKASRF